MTPTTKNTCPYCGSKRNGRNLELPCPSCARTHEQATTDCQAYLAAKGMR